MVTAVALTGLIALASQKLEIKLADLEPVTAFGSKFSQKTPFSIGGIVVQSGFGAAPNTDGSKTYATYVFSIPDKASSFRGFFGIQDDEKSKGTEGILSVYVDGELVKEFRAESDQKPTKIEIALTKASSMKLVFEGGGALANSVFSTLGKQEVAKVDKPKPADTTTPKPVTTQTRVNVTAPAGGETFSNSVAIKWDKVDDAISYGVEIILIRNNDAKIVPTRLLRAFTVKGESFEWNLSEDVVSGEYQISVIAFSRKGVITMFSLPKRFKITRK